MCWRKTVSLVSSGPFSCAVRIGVMYTPLRHTRDNPPKRKDTVLITAGQFCGERRFVISADAESQLAVVWIIAAREREPRFIPFSDLKPSYDVTPASLRVPQESPADPPKKNLDNPLDT